MHHQRCFVLCFFFSSTYLGKLAICIYIPPHTRSFFFCSLCWNSKLFLLSICFGQGRLTCVCASTFSSPSLQLVITLLSHRTYYLFYPLCYAKRSVSFFLSFFIYTYTSFFNSFSPSPFPPYTSTFTQLKYLFQVS